ncbi:DUF4435 domain-containing protein [Pseudomonas aeruginosa]|uniref:DUF4435 domain-containing protein n=1 Tax=Pseudomonas aeruginosa TaxID=287 RepID=UPI00167FDDC0|nr:DUF4435 domain-containing protein [Pseudomonas aeruginosa]MBD1289798.1 DUF4435 domain-containing protein [Pseudomonas aeruginosa]
MPEIPKYSGEENLRRIRMQKKLTFVIVEGSDDVPIYESCLNSMVPDCNQYDIVFAGGKSAIRTFLQCNSTANAIFVIDRDFNDIGLTDRRIVSLEKYSIENYFICEEVISNCLRFVLGCKFKDAYDAFSLDEYTTEITEALELLIKVIFYYQRVQSSQDTREEKPSWSDTFLCENASWRLCREKIRELISLLLPTPELINQAEEYYEANFSLDGSIVDNFPGKMLKHSLQRYVKQKVIELKPGAKGKFGDVETARMMFSSTMHRSSQMARVLAPVVNFLRLREASTV